MINKSDSNPCQIVMRPSNIIENIKQIKTIVGEKVMICAVLKANAYGHGLQYFLNSLSKSDINYIGCVDNWEFALINDYFKQYSINGIKFIRLTPASRSELEESFTEDLKIEEIAGSLQQAQFISQIAKEISQQLNKNISVNIHLSIETGMHRMGIRKIEEMKSIQNIDNLKVVGVMTHFSRAYGQQISDELYTKKQVEIFEEAINQLKLSNNIIRHIANSAATMKFKFTHFDMVRVGQIIYGEDKDDTLDPLNIFKPIITAFKTKVTIIQKSIPPNTPINYFGLQQTRQNKDSIIATIRIGYYNGINQLAFNNNQQVLIRGKRFPFIGRTSMNMVVIDVTDQDEANPIQLDDEVILIGQQGNDCITFAEFAAKSGIDIKMVPFQICNQASMIFS